MRAVFQNIKLYMWQSRVEIEHYSVAYFSTALPPSKHCSAVLPLRAGLICAMLTYQALINGSTALQRFERGKVVKIRNGIMFLFDPGLPHILFARLIRFLMNDVMVYIT